MHLRRTSWIALALAVSVGVAGWSLDATAHGAPLERRAPRTVRPRQRGFMGLRTLAVVATAAVLGSTCTILPTMEGRVFPTGKDRWCTAAQVEATGRFATDFRQGIVLLAPARGLTNTGITWDYKTFTGVAADATGAPVVNWIASAATGKDLTGLWHLNGSLGGMTIESGCKGDREPVLGTLAGGLQRFLRRDEDRN